MKEFVIIKDMAAGNEAVGEMWQETKIFKEDTTLNDVMEWAMGDECIGHSRKRITITMPHGQGED